MQLAEARKLPVLRAMKRLHLRVQRREYFCGDVVEWQPPDILAALHIIPTLGGLGGCERAERLARTAPSVGGHQVDPFETTSGLEDAEVHAQQVLAHAACHHRLECRRLR